MLHFPASHVWLPEAGGIEEQLITERRYMNIHVSQYIFIHHLMVSITGFNPIIIIPQIKIDPAIRELEETVLFL
jgi:hypothetical protein